MGDTLVIPGITVTDDGVTVPGTLAVTGVATFTGELVAPIVTRVIADPGATGAIPATGSGQVALVSAGAETRTFAAPAKAGLDIVLAADVTVGNIVVTCATTFNAAGNNTLTFTAAGQMACFRSVKVGSNFRWRPYALDGAALSTV